MAAADNVEVTSNGRFLNKVPVREQDAEERAKKILKKFVTDIMKKRRWRRQQDVVDVKMHSA